MGMIVLIIVFQDACELRILICKLRILKAILYYIRKCRDPIRNDARLRSVNNYLAPAYVNLTTNLTKSAAQLFSHLR